MSDFWMQTFPSGAAFDLLEPLPEQVKIEDIAHHLSHIARFTGATPHPYSVAQHSVLVARQLPHPLRKVGLMHDSPEAYLNDVSRPTKMAMRFLQEGPTPYDRLEQLAWGAISKAFNLPEVLPQLIKEVDMRMLATEKLMLGIPPKPWDLPYPPYTDLVVQPWAPWIARAEFMKAWELYK